MRYEFLGRELGARRVEAGCYRAGRVDYRLVPATPLFRAGLDRARAEATAGRPALFCAEEDPLHCHRAVLVFRHLRGDGLDLAHVRGDGRLEPHAAAEARLLELARLPAADLFRTRAELVEDAYDAQGDRLGYARPEAEVGG